MDAYDKIDTLVSGARFDACGAEGTGRPEKPYLGFVHRAAVPGSGCMNLFKVLLTNACTNDCGYCVNQVGLDRPRTSFRPEELAGVFAEMYRRRRVSGLFLTSGIAADPTRTMTRMIETVDILRHRYDFRGYVHLKILPGAAYDCVEAACRIASRVSVNMEAPTAAHLAKLSSKKDIHHGIMERMLWVKKLTANDSRLTPSGQTTQFVVGAAGETDRDILTATGGLYRDLGLRRVYYSAYRPIGSPRLEDVPAAPPMREHRLYQADWLMRVYGFPKTDIDLALGREGNLSLRHDPKELIAARQPWLFPMDINRAGYNELLRAPGIGPICARRIIETRREHSIFSLEQLTRMGAARRAEPYIWFQGMPVKSRQLALLLDPAEERELVLA
jgi:predicted DNA-binding helix-hairpin-helix protein